MTLPPDAPEFAIQAEGLVKTYPATKTTPAKTALKGLDLAIRRGAIFGLLGPNGAGKSTFINILAGLVNKTAGQVSIWGMDIDAQPRTARGAIGVVHQEIVSDVFFTPREALEVQAGFYGVKKADRKTDEILASLGLADKADAYVRQLSGGMKRRLMVAKAMVHSPPILILDEPTAGVDVELRRQLWERVQRAECARGVTIVLTTHYLEEAQALCDTIAIVNQGRAGGLRAHVPAPAPPGHPRHGDHPRRTPGGRAGARRLRRQAAPRRQARDLLQKPEPGGRGAGAGGRARSRRPASGTSPPRTRTWRTCSWPSPTATPRPRRAPPPGEPPRPAARPHCGATASTLRGWGASSRVRPRSGSPHP